MAKAAVDDLKQPLDRLLSRYMHRAGTDVAGAVRDVLTELLHFCDRHDLDFAEREHQARQVYIEELEQARHGEADDADEDEESGEQVELLVVIKPEDDPADDGSHVQELEDIVGHKASSVDVFGRGIDVLFHVESVAKGEQMAPTINKLGFVKSVLVHGEPV